MGFRKSWHDYSVFVKNHKWTLVILLVYVDDILVNSCDMACIDLVKQTLHDLFKIKDLGNARYFLGMEFTRNNEGISSDSVKD